MVEDDKHVLVRLYNNQLSVTRDYDCILAMLLTLSKNGRLKVTWFSVPTTFETVSVIQRNALTAPGSLNTCPYVRRADVAHDIIVVHRAFQFRSRSERPSNLGLKACWRLFVNCHSQDSICQQHDWQPKPFPTAPPISELNYIFGKIDNVWQDLKLVLYITTSTSIDS